MHRYETPDSFFEIALVGTTLKTVTGKLGTPGETVIEQFPTEVAAKAAHDSELTAKTKARHRRVPTQPIASTRTFERGDQAWTLTLDGMIVTAGETETEYDTTGEAVAAYNQHLAEKLQDGYVERVARNPELEHAIASDPYDATSYSVLADWLQARGDPRGELIALQLASKDMPALDALTAHASALLGPLAEHVLSYDGLYYQPAPDAFTWKYGFIHRARMSYNHYANEDFDGDLSQVLELLLRHPSGRFLAELTLMYNDDPSENDLQSLIGVLAKLAPASFRKLVIGDAVDQISWYRVGNLGPLWPAVPYLNVLEIEAGSFALGAIELPALQRAIFKTGGLSQAAAKAIAEARWPAIEHLEVYFGDPRYGGDCTIDQVVPLLARTDLPELRHLGLMNAMFTDDIVAALPTSKLLPQLTHLNLSLGLLTDAGATLIDTHRDSFAHLDVLDVSQNYLTAEGIGLLRGVCDEVITGDQKDIHEDDPEFRYVTISE